VKRTTLGLLVLTLLFSGGIGGRPAWANALYGATGSNGVNGELVILSPTTGAVTTDIGALVDGSGNPYGMTGLAFQPGTGALFGSTANVSPTASAHLVRINPATAQVTDIGSFSVGSTMSDITFDRTTGTLYGWHAAGDHSLYTVDLTTGLATQVGTLSRGDFGGGGLAADAAGNIYSTPDGVTAANPTLRTVDKVTGATTTVASLSGGPLSNNINALDFDSAGTLYGINNDRGLPSRTHLVTIDTATGVNTDIGGSLDNLDAIAFQSIAAAVPEPAALTLFGAGAGALAACASLRRRRK
jgi:hypothetical protein